MKTVGVRQLKNEATQIVREVRENSAEYIITVDGEPVARLTPYHDPDREQERRRRMQAWLRSTDELAREISAVWPEGVSAADAVAEQRR